MSRLEEVRENIKCSKKNKEELESNSGLGISIEATTNVTLAVIAEMLADISVTLAIIADKEE